MKIPDVQESTRTPSLDAQAASDHWRGVRPKAVFSLDQKDYPEYVDQYHAATMKVPNTQQDSRGPSLDAQASDDHWRGVRPVGVFGLS